MFLSHPSSVRAVPIGLGSAFALSLVTLLVPHAEVSAGVPVLQPAMGDPLPGLTPTELARFDAGKIRYGTNLTEPEGLGPVFNKESCGNCHANPFGGPGSQTVTRFGQAVKGGFNPLPDWGGSLLQAQTIDQTLNCVEEIPAVANRTSLRVTNGSLGYGLIEAIPDADIEANETTPPLAGISGRVHWVTSFEDPDPQPLRAGRFGWKAQVATLLTFSADAALNEMGLTNRFLMEENDPNGIHPPALGDPGCDTVPDPEDGPEGGVPGAPEFIDRVTDFQRFLAAPPQTPKSGMTGETIFNNVGCASCHVAQFTTNNTVAETALQSQVIRPYSDFLLHDMGQNADFIAQGDATDRELRTPVLWGLRTRDPVWHDGRFQANTFENRMTAAIEAHFSAGSEATVAGLDVAWNALTPLEKSQLIQFLDSLGRLEFDADGDNDIDFEDFLSFEGCFFPAGQVVTPDDACAVHDIDQDGDVDTDDFDGFLAAYSGDFVDCNENGTDDIEDIILGVSMDTNFNGIPDECTCTGDVDGNNVVGFADVLQIISAWGCTTCPEDINGSGLVDFGDILLAISEWGPCG